MDIEKGKFIVINKKFLDQLNKSWQKRCIKRGTFVNEAMVHPAVKYLYYSMKDVINSGKKELQTDISDRKYLVCNQDEEYSNDVLALILQGEDLKDEYQTS